MSATAALKVSLIQQITNIDDDTLLIQLKKIINELNSENKVLTHLAKPTRAFLDLENLKKTQGFTNFDETKFDELLQSLAIEEPYEDLVSML
jgi:hypothetical protein